MRNTEMKLTEGMVETLDEIRRIETADTVSKLDDPAGELGNKLIELYYHSDNNCTRELIVDFMKNAGIIWLRKLLTRDTNPTAAPDGTLASLTDYLGMMALEENSGANSTAGWR